MKTPPFAPPLYLSNRHVQTLWKPLFHAGAKLPWKPQKVSTPDGDFIHVWLTDGEQNKPVVFFVHGLEGTIDAPFIREVGAWAMRMGWRVGAFSLRGCGVENDKHRLYHAGDAPDVYTALQNINQRASPCAIHTVGLSLGGNILANFLADYRTSILTKELPVVSSALLSSPHLLAKSVVFTEKALFGLYQFALLHTMKKNVQRKTRQFPERNDAHLIRKVVKLSDYDEYFTAPQNGFASADDYYSRTSSIGKLNQIPVPSLYLYAMDDPIVPPSAVPLEWKDHENPLLKIVLTQRGGHLGWVTRTDGKIAYWGERVLEQWLKQQQLDM